MSSSIFTGETKAEAVLVATHSHLWNKPECIARTDLATWMQGREPCEDVVRNALEIVHREPSIKAIVLVSLNTNPFFLSAEKLEALHKEFDAPGRKLVYVGVVPRFGLPPATCRPRVLSFFGTDFAVDGTNTCAELESLTAHQQDDERALVLNARSKLLFYDPRPTFCDSVYCHQDDAGNVLFWHDGHVNVRGSARMLGDFLTWAAKNVPDEG
jgi:SGNH domain (fused to AT3 domains)